MRTSNPVLSERAFGLKDTTAPPTQRMTVEGTVYKTALLLLVAMATAAVTWRLVGGGPVGIPGLGFTFIALLGLGFTTAFKPRIAIVTGPLYALVSGAFIGVVTSYFEQLYPGIAIQAGLATMTTAAGMLIAHRTGLIRATKTFRKVVVTATLGILLLYVASFAMSFFGIQMPLTNDSGPLGIAISLFITGIAALNLILDFDFIEQAAAHGAEARMEWYGAFSVLVTLVWLYLEMLRLIGKLRD